MKKKEKSHNYNEKQGREKNLNSNGKQDHFSDPIGR